MEFEEIDDFSRYLNLNDGEATGRVFEHLINKYFDEQCYADGERPSKNDDLILCLLDMVTLVDRKAKGDTLLRSQLQKKSAEDFINNYKAISRSLKKDSADDVTRFKNWYGMGTFMLMVSNPESESYLLGKKSSWNGQPIETMKDFSHERSLYSKIEENLSTNDVKSYLKKYYNQLVSKLNFDAYPNLCIIVKPISVSNGGDKPIPLGHLCLHFATKSEKSQSFYLRLINDFVRIWYQEKGYEVISETSSFEVSAEGENKKNVLVDFKPNFYEKKKRDMLFEKRLANNLSLSDYYNFVFCNPKDKKEFEVELFEMVNRILPIYKTLKNKLDFEKTTNISVNKIELICKLKVKNSYLSLLKKSFDLKAFKNILLYREAFKIGVFIFDLDPNGLHYALTENSYKPFVAEDTGTLVKALWSERFIPLQKKKYNALEIKSNIQKYMGQQELNYMEKYKKLKSGLELKRALEPKLELELESA